jgi:hypothetical protein
LFSIYLIWLKYTLRAWFLDAYGTVPSPAGVLTLTLADLPVGIVYGMWP